MEWGGGGMCVCVCVCGDGRLLPAVVLIVII